MNFLVESSLSNTPHWSDSDLGIAIIASLILGIFIGAYLSRGGRR